MFFDKPLIETDIENIFHLAPIPVYCKVFEDDELHKQVYDLGLEELSLQQKRMGQELPERYDEERQSSFNFPSDYRESWVEDNDEMPIGSRFWTPPNDFLDFDNPLVKTIRNRVEEGYKFLTKQLGKEVEEAKITESWLQYYDPYEGRGHNQHNHCRWSRDEIGNMMFSGGYYLSDGLPIKDHPYSGVYAFHVRGQQYMIRPKRGMLMIWPYDIVHSVKPFYGKEHRSVINCNIQNGK